MAKIVNISEIHPCFGFLQVFDILEKYPEVFNEWAWQASFQSFPFECCGKSRRPVGPAPGTRGTEFSPFRKDPPLVLKAFCRFSDRQLVEHLNRNIHYQIFCGIMIPRPFHNLTR